MMTAAINTTDVLKSAPKLLKKRQKHSRWLGLVLGIAMLFVKGRVSEDSFMEDTLESLGSLVIAVCVVGRSYCSAYIGGIKNDRVMREGPFSVVRNPLYVFSFIGLIGIGMISEMATVTLAMLVAFIVYYKFVVAREEAFLLNKFGEEYARYKQEVPRWWPKWPLWHEPEEITVRPKFLRRTMMDGLLFFLPFMYFEVVGTLQSHGVLPILLRLP